MDKALLCAYSRPRFSCFLGLFVIVGLLSSAGCGGGHSGSDNGSGISAVFSADYFPLTYNANQIYRVTNAQDATTPVPNNYTGNSILGGLGIPLGATTQVSLGGVMVERTELLDAPGVAVSSYKYYTVTDAGYTDYGIDYVVQGIIEASERNTPPIFFPFTLKSGQSYTQSYQVTEKSPDGEILSPTAATTQTTKFDGFETLALATGKYAAAKFTTNATTTRGPSGAADQVTTDSYYVAGIGLAQSHQVDVNTIDSPAIVQTTTITEDATLISLTGTKAEIRQKTLIHSPATLPARN